MSSSAVVPMGEKISLYYKDGGSDKVYHAQLESSGSNFVVNFQYGRRGSTLQSGTKTTKPTSYDAAKKIFDKLVAEKKAKGYTEGEGGTPFQGSDKAGQKSGLNCQLLNFIDEDRLEVLLNDPKWMMQEKMDGRRLLVRVKDGAVEGINRKGLVVGISSAIEAAVKELGQDITLDGEAIGDTYYVFDVLEANYQDVTKLSYALRHTIIENGLALIKNKTVRVVPGWIETSEKKSAIKLLREEKAEGVVFKNLSSPYVAGRPSSGGNQLKYKFYSTATCRVYRINDKRSVEVAVSTKHGLSPVGNVTIPVNQSVPEVGDIVEVRYLYWYPGGSLFQPTYLGLRDDKDHPDPVEGLKPKQSSEDEES